MLDTAIDEGGPVRHFKSDVWNQLSALAVPVLKVKENGCQERVFVRIFREESNANGNYAVPITDAILESRLKEITSDIDKINSAIQCARDYTRAIGRIMLNSFFHQHTVSASAMSPLFINGESDVLVFSLSCLCLTPSLCVALLR